jgi:hypothetical protein
LDVVKSSGAVRQILPIDLPWIPGHEFSGIVEQIGSDVEEYAPGDAVFGVSGMGGAYAEYLAVKPATIARKPSNLSFEEAASVPVASQTAWQGIFTQGHLEKGQTILIHQNRYKFFAESSGVDYCPSTRQSIFRGGQDQTQSSPFAANLLIRPPRAWPIRSTGTIGVGPP